MDSIAVCAHSAFVGGSRKPCSLCVDPALGNLPKNLKFVVGSSKNWFTCNAASISLKYIRGRVELSSAPSDSFRKCWRCLQPTPMDIAAYNRLHDKNECIGFVDDQGTQSEAGGCTDFSSVTFPFSRFFRRGEQHVDLSEMELSDSMTFGMKAYIRQVKALRALWDEKDEKDEDSDKTCESCCCVDAKARGSTSQAGDESQNDPFSAIGDILAKMRAARVQREPRARKLVSHFSAGSNPPGSAAVCAGRVRKNASILGDGNTRNCVKKRASTRLSTSWRSARTMGGGVAGQHVHPSTSELRMEFSVTARMFRHWDWLTLHGFENHVRPKLHDSVEGGSTPTVQDEGSMYAPLTQDAFRRLRSWFPHVIYGAREPGCDSCSKCPDLVCSPPSKSKIGLTGSDLARLYHSTRAALSWCLWLNDELINQYFHLLEERSKRYGVMRSRNSASEQALIPMGLEQWPPRVKVFNTLFYVSYCYAGKKACYDNVSRWTRNYDVTIERYDVLLFPVNTDAHWFLVVVDNRKKTIEAYDSLGGTNMTVLQDIRSWLEKELIAKGKGRIGDDDFIPSVKRGLPRQLNEYDCGMFCCKFADFISKGITIDFKQKHMAYFRARMAHELLVGHVS